MASIPKFQKPRYPRVSDLDEPASYTFDANAEAHDWLTTNHNPSGENDVVEHILEYRFVKRVLESWARENPQAGSRLNQNYRSWAGNNIPTSHLDTNCFHSVATLLGSTQNPMALCILDRGLNQIKTNVSSPFISPEII
jgi:hypothetical protein